MVVLTLGTCLASACDTNSPSGGPGDTGALPRDAGNSSRADGGGPAVPSDSGSVQGDAALPVCTDTVTSCPATVTEKWRALIDAQDFGSSARLVALGGRAVLVDVGDGTFLVASVLDQDQAEASGKTYTTRSVPSGNLVPVAIAEAPVSLGSSPSPTVVALVCDASHESCSLVRGGGNEPALAPWQGTELPSGFVARGLVFDVVTPTTVCVYGNGLLCFDQAWKPAIAVQSSLRINDVSMGPLWSLAVGDDGRWYKRERRDDDSLSAWIEQPSIGTTSLSHASSANLGGFIVGAGRLQAALGGQRELYGCTLDGEIEALLPNTSGHGLSTVVTSSGQIVEHAIVPNRVAPYCVKDQLPDGAILEASSAPCGGALNPRVLTEKALYGQNLCITL